MGVVLVAAHYIVTLTQKAKQFFFHIDAVGGVQDTGFDHVFLIQIEEICAFAHSYYLLSEGSICFLNYNKKGLIELLDLICSNEIERIADACFKNLANNNYFKNLEFNDFVDSIVDFYCITNMLHPFREGNGRVQRLFIAQLIRYNGYDINFNDIDADELMIATIQAANGVIDQLKNIFKNTITMQYND